MQRRDTLHSAPTRRRSVTYRTDPLGLTLTVIDSQSQLERTRVIMRGGKKKVFRGDELRAFLLFTFP